jgi:hypothetical protein
MGWGLRNLGTRTVTVSPTCLPSTSTRSRTQRSSVAPQLW